MECVSPDGKWVYFSNSAQGIFRRVPVSPLEANIGDVDVIATVGVPTGVAGAHFNDLALDEEGKAWIAPHPSDVIEARVGEVVVADF